MSVNITLPARRFVQALFLIAPPLFAGCGDTSQSPENPRIIGMPPQVAYLGVDYSYNFGATGGDNLLNYSLVNNPSWLALEATTNKARKGIVLRGVPGITGGGSGEADLGDHKRVRVTTNDGSLLGNQSFNIEVRHNPLEVSETTLTEGEANEPAVDKDTSETCEAPDMDVTRKITVQHDNLVQEDGDGYESQTNQYTTRRSLIRVDLGQPSVKPVTVRFRVSDDQDRSDAFCNDPDAEAPCEYRGGNRDRAIFGEDLLLNGNAANYQGGGFPEPPEYIDYISEGETGASGLLNFEAGQTTCFIPVWVHDDTLAEDTEYFNVTLERVTEGMASLSENGAVAGQRVDIEDETPSVSLDESTVVLSEGIAQTVTATLNRTNDTGETLYASLKAQNEAGEPANDDITPLPLLVSFQPGEKKATLALTADDLSVNGALEEEVVRELRFDRSFQFGRDGAAGTDDDATTAYINEWTSDVSSSDLVTPFTIESLVAGAIGEVYVAGRDGSGAVGLQSINRLGTAKPFDDSGDVVAQGELNGGADWPVAVEGSIDLAFAGDSDGTDSAPDITRYLGLVYSVEADPVTGFASLFRSRIFTDDSGSTVRSDSPDDRLWKVGSPGDSWRQQAVAVTTGGSLYAAGVGAGSEPIRMTRVDTEEDDDGNPLASRAWTEDLRAGDSNLAGLFSGGASGVLLAGDARGQVDADTVVGGRDFFLLGRDGEGSVAERVQFGVDADDEMALAEATGDRIWLAGESTNRYERNDTSGLASSGTLAEAVPYVVAVNRAGAVEGVLLPDAVAEDPGIASIQALTVAGGDAVIAGQVDEGAAYLMAMRYTGLQSDGDESIRKLWRINIDDADGIVDMDYFNNRKIFVVLKTGSGRVIRLYDRHGNRLTETGSG